MLSRGIFRFLFVLFLLSLPLSLQAEELPVDFDIQNKDSILTVWIDFSSLLGLTEREYLENGQGLVLDCKIELKTPRKIFGSRTINKAQKTVNILKRLIIDDFVVSILSDESGEMNFQNIADLQNYLEKSINIPITHINTLDKKRAYRLSLKFTSISITNSKLIGLTPDSSETISSFSYLFKQFLKFTDHGKREFSIETRYFTLEELTE